MTASAFAVFLSLAIICDDFLCPAIDIICDVFSLSDDIAGATLLAFGSSAPEIFMNLSATAKGQVNMSLPAVLGSAIIAFGFIPPACAYAVAKPMKLEAWPVMRDSVSYVFALGCFYTFLDEGNIDTKESGILVAIYFVYLLLIFVPHFMSSGKVAYEEIGEKEEAEAAQEEGEDEEGSGCIGMFFSVCSKPIHFVFSWTVPVQPEESTNPSAPLAFFSVFMSLVWVTILSSLALEVADNATTVCRMKHSTAGATLLAAGAQIPDLFGSLSMAKGGMPGGAISNAVGSQVINVSLGVGAPFLAYNLLMGQPINAGSGSEAMRHMAVLLMVVILVFWIVVLPMSSWCMGKRGETKLGKGGATVLMGVAIACYWLSVGK
ncbi:hypothetical protein TL16_g08249 [Triparma laevis f. inornata]|uniref:Sodium/calcium exchanger membrane region domain-containing protein n=1 Tax=Triparma laevis f. inornata TaxID=1714386 RepID=A0A9W7B4H1_9STRA|nr:hypothetical protein TL16_g08249 [Triparma laevis f. inornata]